MQSTKAAATAPMAANLEHLAFAKIDRPINSEGVSATSVGVGVSHRFPDFIIGGAPKCGTTSLHFVLGQHADIGLPDEEIHYFDADDPITHPDFFFVKNGALIHYDNTAGSTEFRAQYADSFSHVSGAQWVGEDSTTYLFSEVAPVRIKAMLPEVKLIFMLRDPVARAYSQYWHLVRTARIACTFEKAITAHPSIMLGSTYLPHLQRFQTLFPPEQIKVLLFEDFTANTQGSVDAVTDYLGAPRMAVSEEKSWFNKTVYPTSLDAQLALNRIGRQIVAMRYANHLGSRFGARARLARRLHYLWFAHANRLFLRSEKKPAMRGETRAFLTEHFSRRNQGLSRFLGRDLSKVWKGFDG
ncbi:MAG: sulfotransferase [Pseudomonadota bacterium]